MGAKQVLVQEKARYPRVEPPCPYFGTCGGCALQDLAYPDQLALKRERLQQALAPLIGELSVELVGTDPPWRYRNKAELTFGQTDGRLVLGYHAARSFWRLVDLEDCLLLPASVLQVAREVRQLAQRTGLAAYNPKTHQGFFRHLLIRSSAATGQMMLCLITSSGSRQVIESIADDVIARHPTVSSLYWGLTSRLADIARPEELVLLRGSEWLEDQLGPFRLRLHPLTFLQPNSAQAARLYDVLCRALHLTEQHVAWDLYCGVGLVSFYLSRHVRKVYGIDVEPHHLTLAQLNASLNDVRNVEFRVGQVEALLMDRRFWLQEARPDVVVVDPPRAGLHPRALSSLLAARPRQLAYISCNAQSLTRDLRPLLSGFPRYRLTQVQAFDMFPQTNHVEILALLER